jgi:hypothetical protein
LRHLELPVQATSRLSCENVVKGRKGTATAQPATRAIAAVAAANFMMFRFPDALGSEFSM